MYVDRRRGDGRRAGGRIKAHREDSGVRGKIVIVIILLGLIGPCTLK
jgi:hypothetical protein